MPGPQRGGRVGATSSGATGIDDRYRWVALANTTASVFMSALDSTTLVFNTPS